MKFAAAAVILASALAQGWAASTNIVQNINFQFTVFEQGPTNKPSANVTVIKMDTTRLTTKDIIVVLGTATKNTFSKAARLVRVTGINGGLGSIEVRDGANVVDVTSYFAGSGNSTEIGSSTSNSKSGISSGVTMSLFHLSLGNVAPASLTADGLATTHYSTVIFKKVPVEVDDFRANLAGSGTDTSGAPFVTSGSLTVLGHTIEVK